MITKHGGHIFWEIHEVRKGMWFFFFVIALFGCWLAGQANSDHVVEYGGKSWVHNRLLRVFPIFRRCQFFTWITAILKKHDWKTSPSKILIDPRDTDVVLPLSSGQESVSCTFALVHVFRLHYCSLPSLTVSHTLSLIFNVFHMFVIPRVFGLHLWNLVVSLTLTCSCSWGGSLVWIISSIYRHFCAYSSFA